MSPINFFFYLMGIFFLLYIIGKCLTSIGLRLEENHCPYIIYRFLIIVGSVFFFLGILASILISLAQSYDNDKLVEKQVQNYKAEIKKRFNSEIQRIEQEYQKKLSINSKLIQKREEEISFKVLCDLLLKDLDDD